MLDPQYIRDNLDAVKANCKNRNVTADVDRVVTLDDERKRLISAMQVKQQEANASAKAVGQEKDPAKKQGLIARGKQLRGEIAQDEAALKQVEADLKVVVSAIPNMTHPAAPIGRFPRTTRSSRPGASRQSSISSRRTMSLLPRRSIWSISRRGRRSRGRNSIFSRTMRCCWNWPSSITRWMRCSSTATRRSSRRIWPAWMFSKGSASCHAGKGRRFTRSPIPICA